MTDVRRLSWSARLTGGPAFVLLSLAGAWAGHTVQYAIGHGTAPGPALAGSVHFYMVPAGAVLAGIVFAASVGWARALHATYRSLARVRAVLAGRSGLGLADLSHSADPEVAGPGFEPLRYWLMLAGAQLALYVFQENTEAARLHVPLPGIAVLTGGHWTAGPVHLLIALVLVGLVSWCRAKAAGAVTTLAREVGRLRRLLSSAAVAPAPPAPLLLSATPLQRWGRQRWERPPPAVLAA